MPSPPNQSQLRSACNCSPLVELGVDFAVQGLIQQVAQNENGFHQPPVFLQAVGELVLTGEAWSLRINKEAVT